VGVPALPRLLRPRLRGLLQLRPLPQEGEPCLRQPAAWRLPGWHRGSASADSCLQTGCSPVSICSCREACHLGLQRSLKQSAKLSCRPPPLFLEPIPLLPTTSPPPRRRAHRPLGSQANLEPTAQIVKLARDAGFGNVHDYLVHLVTGGCA